MEDGRYIQQAQKSLDAILQTGRGLEKKATEPVVSVSEARTKPVVELTSTRTKTRVLFITTDTGMLNQATKTLDGFTAISDLFEEVHIMVLRTGIKSKNPVLRIDTNTWLYTVTATHAWQLPFFAWSMLQKELEFAEGFRPDIIVARDVGVSAFCAYGAGAYYGRSIQLHIPERYRPAVKRLQRWFERWLVRRFLSIRVTTEESQKQYQEELGDTYDIAVLPRYRGYIDDFTGRQSDYLKKKYPQFSFIVLYVGDLVSTSTAFSAIDAVRMILRNPRVGFLMVGNGTGVMECERRAELLGIKQQVIIERRADDLKQYMESADTLLVTDTDGTADEIALYGAAAGMPMILTKTALREDIFRDGESAYLITDPRSNRTNELLVKLLNNNSDRLVMRDRARQAVVQRFANSRIDYEASYQTSIEGALLVEAPE
jgi:glycosyltransferase involved in cell wall biosynthesis